MKTVRLTFTPEDLQEVMRIEYNSLDEVVTSNSLNSLAKMIEEATEGQCYLYNDGSMNYRINTKPGCSKYCGSVTGDHVMLWERIEKKAEWKVVE